MVSCLGNKPELWITFVDDVYGSWQHGNTEYMKSLTTRDSLGFLPQPLSGSVVPTLHKAIHNLTGRLPVSQHHQLYFQRQEMGTSHATGKASFRTSCLCDVFAPWWLLKSQGCRETLPRDSILSDVKLQT